MSKLKGTVLVTGANGGLGTAFVSQFLNASTPYFGLFTVRSLAGPSSNSLKNLVSSTNQPNAIMPLDLGNLASVRAFANDVNEQVASSKIPKIRSLVLNAAAQETRRQTYTTDGLEMTFEVNYLANFLLVLLLLKSMDPDVGRIVIVSSFSHDPEYIWNAGYATDKLVFKKPEIMARPDTVDKPGDEYKAGMRRYGLSKTLILMFMY